MMISTRRFCGSRTPGPVETSRCVSPKPWIAMTFCGTHQFSRHSLGPPHRKALVVPCRAGRIGVTVDLDPRELNAGGVIRGFLDDRFRTVGQVGLVPVEEHEIRARGCRSGHFGRRRHGG